MNSQLKALGLTVLAAAFAMLYAQGPPGMIRMLPAMAALDADEDNTLSADEIGAAPAALATLDADGNGVLSPDELVPRFGGRAGSGPGGGRGAGPEGPGGGRRGPGAGGGPGPGHPAGYAAPHPSAGGSRYRQ